VKLLGSAATSIHHILFTTNRVKTVEQSLHILVDSETT
jgi:hypothetical protein